ncbi:uncharacterized serine/threonine-protein kinase SBK3-like [Corapipo altera]|uniref:uncharacterized serine/threonine-protein kinase SBK3-like n=1 Tax=Corapipo altera TaxID=415028 RepID=UPI000FD6B12A|nr:uncharacterized serine/threonine-protein kinase SBK3-like [Corapipo altera]
MVQTGRDLPQCQLERDWDVLGELGSGSYGHVVLAQPRDGGYNPSPGVPRCAQVCPHPCPGAPVVLKLLRKDRTGRWGFLREFCTHLCLRGQLTCLQVLPLAFETPTHFGFAQEHAPAGDLCGLLTPGVGLPEPQVKRVATQVGAALDYLHGHALVHRDVKLDNVLAFDPQCQLVKLGDFGLTRVMGWQVGPTCGSGHAPYAAPELCHLREAETLHLEPSLDAWAFGVLLFALLTGTFPWGVAAPPDPQFGEFQVWQGRTWQPGGLTGGGEVPRAWQGLGEAALEMLRRLLRLEPDRRSHAGEVNRYLDRCWGGQAGRPEGGGSGAGTPGDGSDTPEDGFNTPADGSDTPACGREAPGDGLDTPEDELEVPGSGSETAGDGIDAPGYGSDTAGDGSDIPGYGSDRPEDGSDTPGYGSDTAGDGSDTPGYGSDAPGNGIDTAGDGTETPENELDTPGYGSGDGSDSPGNELEAPGDGIETPGDWSDTPAYGSETSGNGSGTPGSGLEEPGSELDTPGNGTEIPEHGLETPGMGWKHLEMG